jgi:uncharacterized protein
MSYIVDISRGPKDINRNFIYKDMEYYIKLDKVQKDISHSIDANAIQNSITNIFTFNPGERIIRPEFGNTLYKYLYETITDSLLDRLGQSCVDMIERWEPRVKVLNVNISPNSDQNEIGITLTYTIPSLGDEVLEMETAIRKRK